MIAFVKLGSLCLGKHIPNAFADQVLGLHSGNLHCLIAEIGVPPTLVQNGKAIGDARKNDFHLFVGSCASENTAYVSNNRIEEALIFSVKTLAGIHPQD